MAVERDITWNIRHFQGALQCDRNFDVVYRVFRICGREACMFFVDGFRSVYKELHTNHGTGLLTTNKG